MGERTEPKPPWTVDAEKTEELRLELRDPDGWWRASVKWDGCIELTRYHNVPEQELATATVTGYQQHLHLCSLDETIRRLQALRAAAIEHFGHEWEKESA